MTTDTCLIADLHRDMQQRATEQQERILHALLAENFREYRPAIEIRLPRIVPPCVPEFIGCWLSESEETEP